MNIKFTERARKFYLLRSFLVHLTKKSVSTPKDVRHSPEKASANKPCLIHFSPARGCDNRSIKFVVFHFIRLNGALPLLRLIHNPLQLPPDDGVAHGVFEGVGGLDAGDSQ